MSMDANEAKRALISLNAELRRREEILREHAAKDLIELERRHPAHAPANLFIVIDEFAFLKKELPEFVAGVIDLYEALRRNDEALAVHAYETWGFRNLSRELIAVLNQWAAFVYAPLMEDRPRLIEETNSGVYGREVAEKVHRDLRRVGGVTPPREFVLMDRAAIGLGSVFMHLRAEINWHRLFHDLIRDFDVKALARRQAAALKAVGLERPR